LTRLSLLAKIVEMKLVLEAKALKDLEDVPGHVRADVVEAMKRIAAAPFAHHGSVKRLKGIKGSYRYRAGDWRAVYRVDTKADIVSLERVMHRREVYE